MSLPETIVTIASATLVPHPGSPAPPRLGLRAEVETHDAGTPLLIRYRLSGPLAALRLPAPSTARRRDGLWHHTCFEAFLKPDESDSYLEFNFAPSGDWAAYRFASRRSGMCPLAGIAAPEIRVVRAVDGLEVVVMLPLAGATDLQTAGAARLGLAAVLEDAAGQRSYWALAHGGGQPDFHDPATFTLVLPAQASPGEPAP